MSTTDRPAASNDADDWVWDLNRVADLDRFLFEVNTLLMRPEGRHLGPDDNPFVECDSIELIFIGFHLSGMGVDLPPGIESSLTTFAELHEHIIRRIEGEHHG